MARKIEPCCKFLIKNPIYAHPLLVEDEFSDEHRFDVAIKTPWYVDATNYLAIGKLPLHLSSRENKLNIQRNTWFSLMDGYLFDTGANIQIHICIREHKIYDILRDFHDEPYRGNFLIEGLNIRYYRWAIFGPQYLKMQINLSIPGAIVKEWVIPFRLMRFSFSHRLYWNHLKDWK